MVKYTEICALYHFCVDLGIKCTIERLYDGYAVRFPDGSDFAQHHGTYGGTEGCVEPAIGDSEFDYTAVGLNLAKDPSKVWPIVDELTTCLITHPPLMPWS